MSLPIQTPNAPNIEYKHDVPASVLPLKQLANLFDRGLSCSAMYLHGLHLGGARWLH